MKNCDICGKELELVEAVIEGVELSVCNRCAKHGRVISIAKKPETPKRPIKNIKEEFFEVIDDKYGIIIKLAREKIGITQKDLAKAISIKESLIHKYEAGIIKPSLDVAKKLEQFLKIKIIYLYEEEKHSSNIKNEVMTIGDIIKIKEEVPNEGNK